MSYYSEEIVEEVRFRNDIVDVVSEYVKLTRKGQYYFGVCPFHKEKTASFSVTPTKQIYYCYGCAKGGNVIHFVMEADKISYVDAIIQLAGRARIELPEGDDEEEKNRARQRKEILTINTEAARFFHSKLVNDTDIIPRTYLYDRGIKDNTITKFGLGFSPNSSDELYELLKSKGYADDILKLSGLFTVSKKGGYVCKFRDRVIYPIFDIRGSVIGFGGRIIKDMSSNVPKYMNSPETPVYNKSKNLYGLNFAKNYCEKQIIVVEGYMDVISLHQCGINNTVASLGTAFTESQGKILKKYTDEIVIAYDSDTAGQAATLRGLEILHDIGCNVKVLEVKDGKDPDEFIRKNGLKQFRTLIDRSISLAEYKIRSIKKNIDTDKIEGKIEFLQKSAEYLAKMDSNVEREMYLKKFSTDYGISQESLYAEVMKRSKTKRTLKTIAPTTSVPTKLAENTVIDYKTKHDEMMLICLICIDNSIYKFISNEFSKEDFTDEENKRLAEIIFERIENNKDIVPAELLNIFDNDAAGKITHILHTECNFDDNKKAAQNIVKALKDNKIEKRKQEIIESLKDKSLPEGDVFKLLQQLKSLTMLKMRK